MQLRERKVIVTGGAAREWIDPVRFISNPSTGKMGSAIADEVFKRCRETVFVHGHVDENLIKGKNYRCVKAETTGDMLHAVLSEMEEASVLIMAAAPADYTPAKKHPVKLKKGEGNLVLELVRTPDILLQVSEGRKRGDFPGAFLAGFAAETDSPEEYAQAKLRQKDLDMICLNDVSRRGSGFGSDNNAVTIFSRRGERVELSLLSKAETAARIVDFIEKMIGE